MKQYLKCLIFAALAALIVSLPAGARAKAQETIKNTSNLKVSNSKPLPTPVSDNTVVSAPAPDPAPTIAPIVPPVPTGHEQLLTAAGVPSDQQNAADKIITMESSWNPTEIEPTTGACGLAQELPCGKSGCAQTDTLCTLEWANTYVTNRYGSWQAALAFHLANGWY